MLAKMVCKYGYKVIANPTILVETAPVLIPVIAFAAVHDAIEYFKK